jgi:hypothetical protein
MPMDLCGLTHTSIADVVEECGTIGRESNLPTATDAGRHKEDRAQEAQMFRLRAKYQ